MDEDVSRIGARIAELRKIHGVTQRALALRANVSYSLLRKVETGERSGSPSFVTAVARALSLHVVDLTELHVVDLTEQPYRSGNASVTTEQTGIPALRQALGEGDNPELDTATRDLADLRAAVAEIKDHDRRTRHAEAVLVLPDVLRHLHRAEHEAPVGARAAVYELLAAAYSYAVVALWRLGHLDLARLADERARTAAVRGDDPLRAAVAEWNHSLILLLDESYPAGLRSIGRAGTLLAEAPCGVASAAVWGALHLRAAILAARAADPDLAETHLAEAQALAAPGQDQANYYGTKFSAPNVAIHRVAVPVELLDGTTAVHRAASVCLPAATAPSRVGAYWIDVARGWLLHGDRGNALDALQTARRIAPQLTRYHPQVHDIVQTLAARDHRATATLPRFAAWCGVRT
ncbi:MAG: helix-turn-helix domain-containing protein [Pseudonocardiaceae bacterium]